MNDPDVVRTLSEHFVAVGVDNADNLNLNSLEKQFLLNKELNYCTQGYASIAADGTVLARGGGFDADGAKQMLRDAMAAFKADPMSHFTASEVELTDSMRQPPDGGLVLYATWKVLDNYGQPQSSSTTGEGYYDQQFASALGVDRLWMRKDEHVALARGEFPESLGRRIARHYLSYVYRGDVETIDVHVRNGRIEGVFRADTGDEGALLGIIETRDDRVTHLEIVSNGLGERIEDCGFAASLTVIPKGQKVRVGMLFQLADPKEELARIPPFRIRDEGYLE